MDAREIDAYLARASALQRRKVNEAQREAVRYWLEEAPIYMPGWIPERTQSRAHLMAACVAASEVEIITQIHSDNRHPA